MKTSKMFLEKAGVRSRLRLGQKNAAGVVTSTGAHRVELVSDEVIEKLDYGGAKKKYMRYNIIEDGELKYYDVKMYDDAKNPHYLVQRLAEFPEGSAIILELKKKGVKSYIEITQVGKAIEADYESEDEIEDYKSERQEEIYYDDEN